MGPLARPLAGPLAWPLAWLLAALLAGPLAWLLALPQAWPLAWPPDGTLASASTVLLQCILTASKVPLRYRASTAPPQRLCNPITVPWFNNASTKAYASTLLLHCLHYA